MTRFPITLLFFGFAVSVPLTGFGQKVIDSEFHHLRNVEPREWSHFPEKAESVRLTLDFEVSDPDFFQVLTFRQEEVKQSWQIHLNGQKLGLLRRDHNHLENALLIPGDILKQGANRIEIFSESDKPDDIRVGDLALWPQGESPVNGETAATLAKNRGYQRAFPPLQAILKLKTTDPEENPLPCRFTIVDADTGALSLIGNESNDRVAIREGVVYSLDGTAMVKLAPKKYRIYAGRGFEFSLDSTEIDLTDTGIEGRLAFELRREVSTPGLVASDPHLHTFEFDRHGDCTLTERLISIAGEGVELPVSTGHDKHIDYAAEANRIGAAKWFTSVLGCEVTTNEGHFNSFPIEPDAKPAEHKLRPWPIVFKNIYGTPGVKVCILNHGRDVHRGFTPLAPENFDAKTGTFLKGRELKANGMEVINSGAQQTDPMQILGDWFALLKSGHSIAAVGSSDSHTVNFAIPGQGRTYLEAPDSDPSDIDEGTAVDSFLAGKTWVSFGLLARLDLSVKGDRALATVSVLGPSWAKADTVRIFRNGDEIKNLPIPEGNQDRGGEKFSQTFTLADLDAKRGDFFCAVATGPGITEPWWPMMPPYQPDSPNFTPYLIGISSVLWIR